jgi:phosphoribosylaminoimidazole-succinocarboxamide synthase
MDDVMLDSTRVIKLPLCASGKVRDIYNIPGHDDKLLFVTTDRISAYDVIMNEGIPGKGRVLTQVALFWFDFFKDVPNHLITADVTQYPEVCQPYARYLEGRSMLVQKLEVFPVECIVRGRLSGSYLKAYNDAKNIQTESPGIFRGKDVCGFMLPMGMQENDILDPPLFTPSTKAEQGLHDENISFAQMQSVVGIERARDMKSMCVSLYERAAKYALERGIVIADTKFELGTNNKGELILIDEVLTPDSSRFWPADKVELGVTPPSFDKQYLRDWLNTLTWDKTPPPPTIPATIISGTQQRYFEALNRLKN